jgi:hypothetical protein
VVRERVLCRAIWIATVHSLHQICAKSVAERRRLKYLAVPALAGFDPLSPGCEMSLPVSAALVEFARDTALRAWFRAYNTVLLFGFFGLLAILLTALLSPGVQRNAAWLTFYSTGAYRAGCAGPR